MLIKNLESIGEVDSIRYLMKDARKLNSFRESDSLLEAFRWEDTAQGHDYWETIFWELVIEGLEDYPY